MAMLKIGLLGLGRVAQAVHIPVLAALPDVEIVAVSESDPRRREAAKSRLPDAAVFEHYGDLLDESDAEAVMICLPTALHAPAAAAAFQSGRHVYLEKPLATSLEDGQQALDAWRQSGKVGMIGFNYRFNPLHQAARDLIQAGRLGELISLRSVFSTPPRELPAWKQVRQSGGGVILDHASHHMDLIRFLTGAEAQAVTAHVQSRLTEDDTAMIALELSGNVMAQSFFSTSAVEEDRLEIYGQAGKLTVDRYLSTMVEFTPATRRGARLNRVLHQLRALANAPYLLEKLRSPWHEPSYVPALAAFVAAVREQRSASPDLNDGYRSLAICLAAEASARAGQVISLTAAAETG